MNIGISGYGRMGALIREAALRRGHAVPVIIDPHSKAGEVTNRELPFKTGPLDVIIDFTEPTAVVTNIEKYALQGVSAVIGTTGWYGRMGRIKEVVNKGEIGLIWSGNFSLGVNIFFRLIREAGRIMNRFDQYDVMLHEYHHRYKADSPSGTAEMAAGILVETLDRKTSVLGSSPPGKICEHQLHVSSSRGGAIPGIHRVIFDSEVDTLVLEHSARNRSGFAEGALLAAEWIQGKKGLFSIDDMMQAIIGGGED